MQTNSEKINPNSYQSKIKPETVKPKFFGVRLRNLRSQFENEPDLIMVRAAFISSLIILLSGYTYLDKYGNFDSTAQYNKLSEPTKAIITDAVSTKAILSIVSK